MQQCAEICAPLSWADKEYILSLVYQKKLPPAVHFPAALVQSSLRELKEAFEQSAELRSLCAALMHHRAESDSEQYIPATRRYGSQARYALMRGDAAGFGKALSAYARSVPPIGLSPELEHEAFWSAVLGAEWEEYRLVPPGAARREIVVIYALRRALYGAPELTLDELRAAAPDLMLGYALLRMDNSLSTLPPAALPPAVHELIRAYWFMRVGQWGEALSELTSYFAAQKSVRSNKKAPGNALLLLVALILAIHQGAPHSEVLSLREQASEMLLRVLPDSDHGQQRELADFFEVLAAWDSVQNRNLPGTRLPECKGGLPLLAMALGARAFSARTGCALPLEAMVAAIEAVESRGVSMLSVYAAAALVDMPELGVAQRRRLSAVLHSHREFASLYSVSEQAAPAAEGRHRLCLLLERQSEPQDKWLYWDLSLNSSMELESLTPRLVQKKPQSTGTELSLQQVLDASLVDDQDERDISMLGLASSLQTIRREQGLPLLADILAAHPRLRLVQGTYRRLVSVRKSRPALKVEQSGPYLQLVMDARQFLRFTQLSKGELALPGYHPRMQAIVEYFRDSSVRIDTRREGEMRWLLATLARDFDLEGELPQELRECSPSLGEVQVRVARERHGYSFELLVKHHAESAVLSTPGQGEAVLLVEPAEGGSVCVRRDMAQEVQAAKSVAAANPVLRAIEPTGDFRWHVAGEAHMLRALIALQGKAPLIWAAAGQREPLLLRSTPESPLRATLLSSHGGWLEIGAELQVDEARVLALTELLEAYRCREGDILPLGEERYLFASPELLAQLGCLSDALRRRGRALQLPLAALPALAAGWQGPLPEFVGRCAERLHECDAEPAPPSLSATLRDYQLQGYRWMLARVRAGLGACLADDMGLGKTVQLLALLLKCASDGPSLVVAPLSLCANWQAEAARFAPSLRVVVYGDTPRSAREKRRAGDLVIASYGQLIAGEDYFRSVQWNIVALDEAQAIKNPDSRRAEVVCSLSAAARLCLTGTPVENSLLDLWSIMRFLNPELLGARRSIGRTAEGIAAVQRVVAPLVLRRTKQEVLPQLPPMMEVEVGIELSAEERALYESIRRRAVERVKAGEDSVSLLAELMRLRRLCCHGKLAWGEYKGGSSKLEMMVQLVRSLHESGHRALVFSQFTDVLDLAQAALAESGFTSLRLDGSMRAAERRACVDSFQRGEAQVFLISLRAGGFGLNLTAADYVILLDPWWNPALEAQAAGRSHRIGQRNPVTVCRLIARDTVEERIMQMHEAKLELAKSVMRDSGMRLELLRDILLSS